MTPIEPFSLSQCQSISSLDFEFLDKGKYLMEPKVDGWRIQMEVTPDGVRAWTRTNHDASRKLPKVEHELRKIVVSNQGRYRLDGEAVFINPDGTPDYNFTARCLGSQTETCIWKQNEQGFLTYFVFDVLAVDGADTRHMPLEQRKGFQIPESDHVKWLSGDLPTYEQHVKNFEQYKEGSVLKLLSAPYAGKRHKSWLKWKEIETIDGEIIGYKEGQGKYQGLIGAIQFIAPDGTIGHCSGMDDETRIYISDHREHLIGTIIEVKHFGKLVEGYRHPQFIRFRQDKV